MFWELQLPNNRLGLWLTARLGWVLLVGFLGGVARAALPPELIYHVYDNEGASRRAYALGLQIYQGRPGGSFSYVVRVTALKGFVSVKEFLSPLPGRCSLRTEKRIEKLKDDVDKHYAFLIPELLADDDFCKLVMNSCFRSDGAMSGPMLNLHNGKMFKMRPDSEKRGHELLWLLQVALKEGKARVDPQWVRFHLLGLDLLYYLVVCEQAKAKIAKGTRRFVFYLTQTPTSLSTPETMDDEDNDAVWGSIEMVPTLDGKAFIPTEIRVPPLKTVLKLLNYGSATGIKPLPMLYPAPASKEHHPVPLMYFPGGLIASPGKGR